MDVLKTIAEVADIRDRCKTDVTTIREAAKFRTDGLKDKIRQAEQKVQEWKGQVKLIDEKTSEAIAKANMLEAGLSDVLSQMSGDSVAPKTRRK